MTKTYCALCAKPIDNCSCTRPIPTSVNDARMGIKKYFLGLNLRAIHQPLDNKHSRDYGLAQTCWICGDKFYRYDERLKKTKDHFIPRSDGGRGWNNIKPAHWACNNFRGNKPVDESIISACQEIIKQLKNKNGYQL